MPFMIPRKNENRMGCDDAKIYAQSFLVIGMRSRDGDVRRNAHLRAFSPVQANMLAFLGIDRGNESIDNEVPLFICLSLFAYVA